MCARCMFILVVWRYLSPQMLSFREKLKKLILLLTREVILDWFTFIADFTWMDVNMNRRNDHMDDVWIIKRPAQLYENLKKSCHIHTHITAQSHRSGDIDSISKFQDHLPGISLHYIALIVIPIFSISNKSPSTLASNRRFYLYEGIYQRVIEIQLEHPSLFNDIFQCSVHAV